MQGVSEASERPGFFKRIMEANVPGIAKAYAAAETLFGQLQVWQLLMIALHTPGGLFFCLQWHCLQCSVVLFEQCPYSLAYSN
jgi:hypothetical protein